MRREAQDPDEDSAAAHQPGWGRLTVAEAASRLSLPVLAGLDRLRENGIEAEPTDRLRDLARHHGYRPSDIPRMMQATEPGAASDDG